MLTPTQKVSLQQLYSEQVAGMSVVTGLVRLPVKDLHSANVSVHKCSEGGYIVHHGGCPWLHYDLFDGGSVMYYYHVWRKLYPKREAA